jgi:hypothetical protein
MSNQHTDPIGQQSQSTALQRTTKKVTQLPSQVGFESQGANHRQAEDEPILVHFNGHFSGQFNGAFILPNNMYQQPPAESDAQIAARRAMAKRSSRSFASRISRTRSRKMEVVGKSTKPGITVDTSFARHRGTAPHQVYPQQNEDRSGGSIKKQGWFGLGRSGTKTKGLGITKGTPQPEYQGAPPNYRNAPHQPQASTDHTTRSFGTDFPTTKDPKTTESLTAGSKSWQEISPWDRPIPIGISVPSDSVPDFSPYQMSRQRSDSDATLATPSIIVTPADAMKSVWSPDTASDYTPARASSMYSRATFNMQNNASHIPPVPALPAHVHNLPGGGGYQSHIRNDTMDSAGTAFEEEDDDDRKDRIMSTGTMFEEDEAPLREKDTQSGLTVDTSAIPTPRRSQGWWNVITTPFVMSRSNSVWTQGGIMAQRTPEMPVIPAEYGARRQSNSSPSTYIWSATEKSPSIFGDSPFPPPSFSTAVAAAEANEQGQSNRSQPGHEGVDLGHKIHLATLMQNSTEKHGPESTETALTKALAAEKNQHSTPLSDKTISPPHSTKPPSSHVNTPALGSVLSHPLNEDQARSINVNIELQDRRPGANANSLGANTSPPQTVHVLPAPSYFLQVDSRKPENNATQQTLPVFPPPPTSTQNGSHFSYDNASRANTPASGMRSYETKSPKQRLGVAKFLHRFALCGRKKDANAENKKKQKRSRCFLCCGCCLVILVLLAILIPLVVVFTKKHNNGATITGTGQEPPSQWLNLTGYPPIPTGVSTIAQPEASEEQSGCVEPATMWSCSLPKEQHADISPNKPDQPNFKLEIVFQNGTVADPSKTRPVRRAANPVSAGAFIRSQLLRIRDTLSPSPASPSVEERKFLGQTTEKNSAPFEGEDTPFFISLKDPKSTSASRLAKRADDPDDPTNITAVIPPPELNSDGTAAPANLLPFPSAQPLRLFNRDTPEEHYGFYTYFDRSIFLKEITTNLTRGGNPADTDGGSLRDAAKMRCTFTQTRFLVQIWTKSEKTKPLLGGSAQNNADSTSERPGTFQYPVTVTLDRHGGEFKKKNLFCYQMEADTRIIDKPANKFFYFEDRTFGGNLVNGTQGKQNVTGPIDGGSGGCGCKWQNWLD